MVACKVTMDFGLDMKMARHLELWNCWCT